MLSSGDSPQITAINTGTRTNGLLVVQIFGLGITEVETFEVEYAGVPMTKNYESNFVGNQWFWCYSMPASSDGIDNLEIDYWLAGAGEFAVLYWVASWYDGAKQSSPYDDSSNGSGSGDPSVTHTPNFNNCLVLGMYKSEANTVLTPGAGETLLHNEDFGTRTGGTSYVIQTTAEAQVVDYSGQDGDWYEFVVSYQEAAVGGYEQECAGSMTPTGANIKNPSKVTTGGVTPSGAPIKRPSMTASGSLTPTGALLSAKAYLRQLIGAVNPTGAILRAVTAVKAGSMQPAGAVLAEARKLLAGSVAPSGAIDYIKSYVRQLAGAIAPSGSLAKSAGKALAGALTPIGSLIKKPLAILSGNLTPTGEKIAGLIKLLSGALTPTGALTGFKSFVQAISGSLAPTAALIKLPAKVLAGSIAPVGSIMRGVKKLLAGVLAAAGALIGTGGEVPTATVYLTVRPRPFDLDLRVRRGLEMALRTRSHDLALHDRED